MPKLTVLLTGIGLGGGVDILKSLRAAKDSGLRIVGTDIDERVPARTLTDSYYTTPRRNRPDFLPSLIAIAEKEEADLLYPLPTADNGILSRRRHHFESRGIRVAAVDRRVFGICQNKWRLYQAVAGLEGVACPETLPVDSPERFLAAAEKLGYPERPFCARRFIGTGAQGFFAIRDGKVINIGNLLRNTIELPDGLPFLFQFLNNNGRFPRLLVQEYLSGEEWDVDLVAKAGRVVAAVPRRNEKMEGGLALTTIAEPNPELLRLSAKIVAHLDVTGAVSLTFMLDEDGKPKLIEINPRLPQSVRCSVAAGVNIPYISICTFMNQPFEVSEPAWKTSYSRYSSGVAFCPEGHPLEA